jgi:hypothetical protein
MLLCFITALRNVFERAERCLWRRSVVAEVSQTDGRVSIQRRRKTWQAKDIFREEGGRGFRSSLQGLLQVAGFALF